MGKLSWFSARQRLLPEVGDSVVREQIPQGFALRSAELRVIGGVSQRNAAYGASANSAIKTPERPRHPANDAEPPQTRRDDPHDQL